MGTEPSSGVMPPPAERWAHRRLGDLIAVGPQNGIYRPGSQYGSGTPIVRIEDYGLDGDIISTSRRRVALDAEAVALYALTPGDILVNRVNSISHLGKAAMVGDLPEPTVFESNMMRFSLDTTLVLPAFVMRFLASGLGRDQLVARARRAVAQSSINQSDVQAVMCPVPPLEEQQLVVDVLSSIDRKITAEIQRRDALAGLYATLTGDLLSARMRVEVVDPNGGAR